MLSLLPFLNKGIILNIFNFLGKISRVIAEFINVESTKGKHGAGKFNKILITRNIIITCSFVNI